ncbi:MAG: ABC transporter permease [Acidobacteriia bacterium]|nr:ABC transporter permease [Terriglobia bacterium]
MSRLKQLLGRRRIYNDLADEIRSHLDERIEELVADGMPRKEAGAAARREFGNVTLIEERGREVWQWPSIESFFADVRFAIRLLRKTPAITAVALLSLALGIGANTAVFSLMNAVMLRMLPVRNPEELVQLQFQSPLSPNPRVSYTNPIFEQLRERQDVFSGLIAWSPQRFDLTDGGVADYVRGMYAGGGYFQTLGVQPASGRLFTPSDDRRGCSGAAVLGYDFWQQHFAGSEGAIGSMLRLNSHEFPVIGVAQAGFFGTDIGSRFDVALPVCSEAIMRGKNSLLDERAGWWLLVMGRLKPRMNIDQAAARLNVLAPRVFEASVPLQWSVKSQQAFLKYTFVTVPAATGPSTFSRFRTQYERPLEILMFLVGLVLLIACANIASLMLARSAARQKEIAVRLSLGASRGRMIRQMLTESVVLSGAGAILGILFARWGSFLLVHMVSTAQNRIFLNLSPDGRVLGFTIGVVILTGLLFGAMPAFSATRVSIASATREGQGHDKALRSRFRSTRWVIGVQVALSLVLLVGTGLFAGTFRNLLALDPGFDRNNVLITTMNVHNAGIQAGARAAFYQQVLDRLKSLPGVVSASQSFFAPISGAEWNQNIQIDGHQPPAGQEPLVHLNSIAPGYFATVRSPLLAGRDIDSRDVATTPHVAVVNETMAHSFFPGVSCIGEYFRISGGGPASSQPLQIVGIVKDAKYHSLREDFLPFAYIPLAQMGSVSEDASYEIRTVSHEVSLIPAVRVAIAELNKAASLQFTTLAQQVDDTLTQERLLAVLSGFFGGLALLLTAIGLYGVMAYAVTRRTHEIGIRMALGARRGSVLRLVMLEVAALLGAGVAAGFLGAYWISRFVQQLLFGVNGHDAWTLALAVAALVTAAAAAGYFPARRAMRVNPLSALRCE